MSAPPASSHIHSRKRPISNDADIASFRACDQCRSRKIKCDRQQPECSNCRKAGMVCDFSDAMKRVNHAKRLHDEFSSVTSRLDRVEAALSKLPEQIARYLPSQGYGPTSLAPMKNSRPAPQIHGGELGSILAIQAIDDSTALETPKKWQPKFERIQIAQGGERIFGYPAAVTLFISTKRQVEKAVTETGKDHSSNDDYLTALAREKHYVQTEFRKLLQTFPCNDPCHEPLTKPDDRAISTPPRILLEPALPFFLKNFNVHIPIFDEEDLRNMIDEHYQQKNDSRSRVARSLILNNIILLSLTLGTQTNTETDSHMGTMGEDLIPSFRKNCDRALANLFEFNGPRQRNVQALVTLALVARVCYGCSVFERVCQMACQVARSIGLNRGQRPSAASWDQMCHQERLFWAIYMLDKQRVFLNGQPCDLYLFDSDLQLAHCSENATYHQRLNAAHVHMMTIWEEIFIALYSCRGARASYSHRNHQADKLRNCINEWGIQHHDLLREGGPTTGSLLGSDSLQIELKYGYHVTQVLINRCDVLEANQGRTITHARTALQLLTSLNNLESLETDHLVAISRMHRNYPPEEDIRLLQAVEQSFLLIHQSQFPCYQERLFQGLRWCIRTLNIVYEAVNTTDRNPILGQHSSNENSTASDMTLTDGCLYVPFREAATVDHQLSWGDEMLQNGLGNATIPDVSFETGFLDFDFYQRLFQQESWDLSTSLDPSANR
ncbi:fungal-specific transcription factor domain-containing protein [Talaromyces proteolyticus]|uniref:Fungal-specific transcription factor domain-containing protein n=1 Tax=Talaromyces proteolyticus TaxID=1131652 RepID=A0AAD4KEG0_9EURO|nr:fungal-specific transcription factor domain-containing protein [Talaromyces proteolyticus]KAH8690302.1 fungal-specific transcription factor domain-containing protein [Talaromyces proteolyticus]